LIALASSFPMQPFAGSGPPSNLVCTLSVHAVSTATPLPSALLWQLSRPVALPFAHLIFPAVHFAVAACAQTPAGLSRSSVPASTIAPSTEYRFIRVSPLLGLVRCCLWW